MTTRYQDAVPFYLEYGFADVGATAANSVVKEWADKGGKVFLKSRPVPIKYFIVSTKVSADEQERIQHALAHARADGAGTAGTGSGRLQRIRHARQRSRRRGNRLARPLTGSAAPAAPGSRMR